MSIKGSCGADAMLQRFHRAGPGEPIQRPDYITSDAWSSGIKKLRKRGFKIATITPTREGQAQGGSPKALFYLVGGSPGALLTHQHARALLDIELELLVDLVIERIAQRARAKGRT